eukprot:CAMPEP_0168562500 /NCGR_PEP_ID=MMETSP0413-20121227/12159_1 /TAXON_ID=136452 /ORGANISM="Filamoeba nolandi, Strain NC-AS-23-1" /LENGTH=696 /DNA_ID=CAMNT_0008593937 /DNA_START=18 /DNA_END=2105 /DNA_ORIENTATION=+
MAASRTQSMIGSKDDGPDAALKIAIKERCVKILELLKVLGNRIEAQEWSEPFQAIICLANTYPFSGNVIVIAEKLLEKLKRYEETQTKYLNSFLTMRYHRSVLENLNAKIDLLRQQLYKVLQLENTIANVGKRSQEINSLIEDYSAKVLDPEGRAFWEKSFGKLAFAVEWETFVGKLSFYHQLNDVEKRDLRRVLDPSESGFFNASRFNEFLLAFNGFSKCIKKMNETLSLSWFYGHLTSDEAAQLLCNQRAGSFIGRFSRSKPGSFAIAYVSSRGGGVKHILLVKTASGSLEEEGFPDNSYDSIQAYVQFFSDKFNLPLQASHIHQKWFFGDFTLEDAKAVLKGQQKGTFLVYTTTRTQGNYSVTFVEANGNFATANVAPGEPQNGFVIKFPWGEIGTGQTLTHIIEKYTTTHFQIPATFQKRSEDPTKKTQAEPTVYGSVVPVPAAVASTLSYSSFGAVQNPRTTTNPRAQYSLTPASEKASTPPVLSGSHRTTTSGYTSLGPERAKSNAPPPSHAEPMYTTSPVLANETNLVEESPYSGILSAVQDDHGRAVSPRPPQHPPPAASNNVGEDHYGAIPTMKKGATLNPAYSLSPATTAAPAPTTVKVHPFVPAQVTKLDDLTVMVSGTIQMDSKGVVDVPLPSHFEAMYCDFRYQITSLGASPIPTLYVSKEVDNNTFQISGGRANQRCSWMII